MNKLKPIALALAAMACQGTFAQTETYNPSWYITPSISIMDPDKRFGVDKNGEGLGLRWGKPLSQGWDVQFGATFARARENGRRYDQTTLGADWLYMFSRDRFRPFLLVGLGAQQDKAEGPGYDVSKSSPYINGGLGFQYAFSDRWSTQIDLRRVHGYLHDNDFGFDRTNNNYLTFGLSYTFDLPAQKVATVAPEPAARPMPAPEPVRTAPAPRFEHYTLSSTELFEFNKDEVHQPQPRLDEIATALNNDRTVNNVVVTGYTDRLGSSEYNQKLSLRRAEAVKEYLVGRGVSPDRISTEGKGEANPVVECKERKRAALIRCLEPNRRVEVEQITVQRRVN